MGPSLHLKATLLLVFSPAGWEGWGAPLSRGAAAGAEGRRRRPVAAAAAGGGAAGGSAWPAGGRPGSQWVPLQV